MTGVAASTARRLVLVGGGHAHAIVMEAFARRPDPRIALTLIAKDVQAAYSGMLPGYVAGHYAFADCHIDLVRLADAAGARLVHGSAVGIDRQGKEVRVAGHAPVPYDVLSIDVGITPDLSGIAGAHEHAIAVKPISAFAAKWQALARDAAHRDGPRRIVVAGGGAAGFELVLAATHRLRREAQAAGSDPSAFAFTLIAGQGLLATLNAQARRLGRRALARRGVALVEHDMVVQVDPAQITLASGRRLDADAVLVATRAIAPAWLRTTGLACDEHGFLALRPTLQTLHDDDVFAAGDCATVLDHPREKSGVFAVRQGPPLAANLRRRALGQVPLPFTPQRQFLCLLSLGETRAIAARGPFAAEGDWIWRWKDHIDRAFMRRFARLSAPSA